MFVIVVIKFIYFMLRIAGLRGSLYSVRQRLCFIRPTVFVYYHAYLCVLCACVVRHCRYDNEYGYSTRVCDLVKYINIRDHPWSLCQLSSCPPVAAVTLAWHRLFCYLYQPVWKLFPTVTVKLEQRERHYSTPLVGLAGNLAQCVLSCKLLVSARLYRIFITFFILFTRCFIFNFGQFWRNFVIFTGLLFNIYINVSLYAWPQTPV